MAFEFFAQLHEIALFLATIYQLDKYQALFFRQCNALFLAFAKYGLMLTRRFKIWPRKDLVCDKRAVENAILLIFLFVSIFKFNIAFAKNLMKITQHVFSKF